MPGLRFDTRRRRRGTATLVLAVAATLIAGLAPSASAGTGADALRHRFVQLSSSPLLSPTARLALAAAAAPFESDPIALAVAARGSKPGTPVFSVRLRAPTQTRLYPKLLFGAATGPGGGAFDAFTGRFDRASNSDQVYDWSHRAPASVLHVFAQTRRAHLVVDTNLANADLRFTPGGETHQFSGCLFSFPGLHSEEVRLTTTHGRLTGRFSFTPNETMFDSTATDVPAVVERLVPEGRPCGGGGRVFCPRQWNFSFSNHESEAIASIVPSWGATFLFSITHLGGSVNYEERSIGSFVSSSDPVTRSPGRVTVNGNHVGPFMSGRISFNRTRQLPRGHSCDATVIRHAFAWSSGSFDLNYDVDPVTLTGPGLVARARLLVHNLP